MSKTELVTKTVEFKIKFDRPVEADVDLVGDPEVDEKNIYLAIQEEIEWTRLEIEKALEQHDFNSVVSGRRYQLAVEL